MSKKPYKLGPVVDADEVPKWARTPPKWSELVDMVLALEPNKSLTVEFEDEKTATRARNAVRDMANLRAQAIVVRTRLEKQDDGGAILYLTKVYPH